MAIILSQLFGFIASVTVLASMQLKNIRAVLIVNVVCNAAGAASYLVLGNVSGCGLYLVAVAQSVLFLAYRLRRRDTPGFWTWVFSAAFLLCSLVTFKAYADVLSMLAAVCCALALAQKNASLYRMIMLANAALWIAYDIVTKAYAMLPAHIITALSAIIGIVRMDLGLFKKKNG